MPKSQPSPALKAKILAIANLTAAVSITAFFFVLNDIAPEPYLGYIGDSSSIVGTLLANSALAIPFLLMAWVLWVKRGLGRNSWWLWAQFVALVLVAIYLLRFLWLDQFNASRGFGLIVVGKLYMIVFLPVWLVGFFLSQKTARADVATI